MCFTFITNYVPFKTILQKLLILCDVWTHVKSQIKMLEIFFSLIQFLMHEIF